MIPAATPGALLQFGQVGDHLLGLHPDILAGVMGIYPIPHRLHAGGALRFDDAADQLGVLAIAQHIGQPVVGQHLMTQDLAHPLGVGDGVGGHMQGAVVIIERGAADQAVFGCQPQRLLQLGLGRVDLHINATGATVLLEPLLGDQFRLFAGQVLGWLLTLRHGLFGKGDSALRLLHCLILLRLALL